MQQRAWLLFSERSLKAPASLLNCWPFRCATQLSFSSSSLPIVSVGSCPKGLGAFCTLVLSAAPVHLAMAANDSLSSLEAPEISCHWLIDLQGHSRLHTSLPSIK